MVCLGHHSLGDEVTPQDMKAFLVPAGLGIYFYAGVCVFMYVCVWLYVFVSFVLLELQL